MKNFLTTPLLSYLPMIFFQNAECCHDVTIVMFSRTFYDAAKLGQYCKVYVSIL